MPEHYSEAVLEAVTLWLPTLLSSSSTPPDPAEVLTDLEKRYRLRATISAVHSKHVQRVALQFPDALLGEAPLVCAVLTAMTREDGMKADEDGLGIRYFILGDTSYGECCVDEIAAQHLEGELVVHYGDCCLSRTKELPVFYVVQEKELVTTAVLDKVKLVSAETKRSKVLLLWDVPFWRAVAKVRTALAQDLNNVEVDVARLKVDISRVIEPCGDDAGDGWSKANDQNDAQTGPLEFNSRFMNSSILWVGSEGNALRNAALKFRNCPFFVWSGLENDTIEKADYKRMLGHRYYLIEKARDAERIGIVAGTLGVSGNLAVIERCKRIIEDAGRKWYVLVVGKPTPSKLANFAEMDAFVLVACPQNSLVDSKEFFRPVITPLELDAALGNGDVYSKPYSVDFTDLLKRFESGSKLDPEVSAEDENRGAVAVRPGMDVSVLGQGGAADFLQRREWKGLDYSGKEQDLPMDQLPTKPEVGRRGIASGYEGENR